MKSKIKKFFPKIKKIKNIEDFKNLIKDIFFLDDSLVNCDSYFMTFYIFYYFILL